MRLFYAVVNKNNNNNNNDLPEDVGRSLSV
jgi:hypothetical protein